MLANHRSRTFRFRVGDACQVNGAALGRSSDRTYSVTVVGTHRYKRLYQVQCYEIDYEIDDLMLFWVDSTHLKGKAPESHFGSSNEGESPATPVTESPATPVTVGTLAGDTRRTQRRRQRTLDEFYNLPDHVAVLDEYAPLPLDQRGELACSGGEGSSEENELQLSYLLELFP